MIIKPRVRGFVCITSHPAGCAKNVEDQIAYTQSKGAIKDGPKKVLVIGCSTGYGLSSRIVSSFGCGAATVGVCFERPSMKGKPASAGWYNTAAFEAAAAKAGISSATINGDAFSDEIKAKTLQAVKEKLGQVDLVVYSLASPRRTHPKTGEVYKSCLKPIGQSFSAKNLNTDKDVVDDVSIEPASEEDIEHTRQVMGGEDWEMWMDALAEADLLAPGATSVAYSYIGPEVTWPVYRDGTIGNAKIDLERSASKIDANLKLTEGRAFISVNKAVVTQASSAIPVVPLYLSILIKVMQEKGLEEGCIEQIDRLYRTQMYNESFLDFDDKARVRVDDWEMKPEVQEAVKAIWPNVTTENLFELTDYATYKSEFLKLFGFGLEGIDYEADIDPEVAIPNLVE